MDFIRKLFILQSVEVVLTYNFTNCNFKKIVEEYENVIYPALKDYMNGIKFNQFESCYNLSDCLMKIEHHTFSPTGGCRTQPFALRTNAALTLHCPGYSRTQINNTQEMMQREVTSNCLNKTSQIQGWWRHFSQISGN